LPSSVLVLDLTEQNKVCDIAKEDSAIQSNESTGDYVVISVFEEVSVQSAVVDDMSFQYAEMSVAFSNSAVDAETVVIQDCVVDLDVVNISKVKCFVASNHSMLLFLAKKFLDERFVAVWFSNTLFVLFKLDRLCRSNLKLIENYRVRWRCSIFIISLAPL